MVTPFARDPSRPRPARGSRRHLDTVPIADNVPGRLRNATGPQGARVGRHARRVRGGARARVRGRRAQSFGGDEAALSADATWIFYDHEEVASPTSMAWGVQQSPRVARRRPGAAGAHRRPRGGRLQRRCA